MQKTLIAMLLFTVTLVNAQQRGPRGNTEIKLGGKKIAIEYGRPALRGRDMLSRIKPGDTWRMGLDEATSLQTETDLHFGAVKVPKGSYTLFAKNMGPGQWALLVNSATGIWGTDYDEKKNIAAIPLETVATNSSVEQLTIDLKALNDRAGEFSMSWGTLSVRTGFDVK
ncbi:MAG: DUF2911 domain-containing protein [Acidobacteria bacterium]|nr:DUF2911 domain-containing protein [Acidobacteriota bacterium]